MFSESDLKALLILLAFVFIWSFSMLLMFAGVRAMPADILVAARAIIASAFMLIFFGKFSDLRFDRTGLVYLGLAAVFGITLAPFLQVNRQFSFAPSASDVVFILSLAPVFMLIGSFAFLEKPTFEKIAGTAIALLGTICILANWEQPSSFAPFFKFLENELWMLGSAVCWAGFTILGRLIVKKYEPATAATLVIVAGSLPLILLVSARGSLGKLLQFGVANWFIITLLGIFGTAIATILWFKALAKVEISKVGSIMFLAPVLITLPTAVERNIGVWGITPMMETPVIVGVVLVIVGIAVVWKKPSSMSEMRPATSD